MIFHTLNPSELRQEIFFSAASETSLGCCLPGLEIFRDVSPVLVGRCSEKTQRARGGASGEHALGPAGFLTWEISWEFGFIALFS